MNAACDLQQQRSGRARLQLGASAIAVPLLNEGEAAQMAGHRMALYEQFTISSHAFAKFSDKQRLASSPRAKHSIITTNQHPSPSLPLSFLPSSDKTQISTFPFFGTMERSFVRRKNPIDSARYRTEANDRFSKSMAATTAAEIVECTMQNTSKNRLGLLPQKSSYKNKEVATTVIARQDTHSADLRMLVKGAECLSIADGLCNVSTHKNELASNYSAGSDNKKVLSPITLQPKSLIQNECLTELYAKEMKLSDARQLQDKIILLDGQVDVRDHQEHHEDKTMGTKDGNQTTTLCGATVHANLQVKEFAGGKVDYDVILHGQHAKVSNKSQERDLSISDVKLGESTGNTALRMDLMKHSIQQIQNVDDPETGCAPPISPQSVMQAVGQLRFWKARLALLRQQQIFSDQLFELHKLVEVQRLIAGTPSVSINEMYFGVGSMITDTDNDEFSAGFIENAENNAESLGHEISSKEKCKAQVILKDTSSRLCVGQSNCSSTTGFVENELNEWRCSSSGLAPLEACETLQPSILPICAFGFTPGSSDGGLVAAAAPGCGAAAAGFPLSLPNLLPPATRSMQSIHSSAIASFHQQIRSSGCKLSEPWGLGALKKHYACEASVGSTINNEPHVSLHQTHTASFYPINSMEPLGYENKEHFRQKNDDVCRSQADNIQRSPIDSMVKAPDNRHLCRSSNEQGFMQSVDWHQEAYVQKMASFREEIRGLKRPKGRSKQDQPGEQTMVKQLDGIVSLNPSMSALNLFPLAPTLTSDGGKTGRFSGDRGREGRVVKAVPRAASSASESAAEILLSLQQERRS